MFLGYNTNGLAHHDVFDAVELLAEIGYRGVAITIDHNALPPGAGNAGRHVTQLGQLLERLAMRSVIETGARFLLDSRAKHEPTLLSEGRRRRIDFYKYAIDCAAELGSDCVSLWSGAIRAPISREHAMDRLVEGLREVLDYAAERNVLVGFEPEPGMLINSQRAFEELIGRIDEPNLRLTLDVGHLHCQGETPIADVIRGWSARLANVHLDDARSGTHEHLMFGEGEIDFRPILRTLTEVGYTGGVYVELSRHSQEGPETARRSFQFLKNILDKTERNTKLR